MRASSCKAKLTRASHCATKARSATTPAINDARAVSCVPSRACRTTDRKDAFYPVTIVAIPPMEDFYIGGASVKLFLLIFKINFPEFVDLALPAEGVFHNLVSGGGSTRVARVVFG